MPNIVGDTHSSKTSWLLSVLLFVMAIGILCYCHEQSRKVAAANVKCMHFVTSHLFVTFSGVVIFCMMAPNCKCVCWCVAGIIASVQS